MCALTDIKPCAEVYFDNSATTPLTEAALTQMEQLMHSCYGNPSSLHACGLLAEKAVRTAREQIMRVLGVRRCGAFDPVLFTAGGTEANNLALFGTAHAKAQYRNGQILISDSEHPSVLRCAQALEKEGIRVCRVPTRAGRLDLDAFSAYMTPQTFLVSIMTVNNETGAIYPVAEAAKIAKRINPDVIIHTDAVQAFGRLPVLPEQYGIDLVSVSAHKIGGPKGVGALYVSPAVHKSKKLTPLIFGGGQEQGYRSGTENVIGIVGFGAAAASLSQQRSPQAEIRAYLCEQLRVQKRFADIVINEAPQGCRAPHILSLTLPGIRSETMLHFLSARGICISAGSACASASRHISAALAGFGLSAAQAACTIRLSFGFENTLVQAERFLDAFADGLAQLVRS
ncbi:MAG: cysteine desulfurase family protein [Eubacteriales bacterium]|nr:cysteine desulfurase family protein [Eubacteriales bacterium]